MSRIERSGLDYKITTSAELRALQDFRAELKGARGDMTALKQSVRTLGRDTSTARSAVKTTSSDGEAAKARRNLSLRSQAERNYANDVQKSAIKREEARVADERAFSLERKVLTQKQARRKAEADISKALSTRLELENRLQVAQERGGALSEKLAVRLGLASKIAPKTDAQLISKGLASPTTFAKANKGESAALAKERLIAEYASRGLDKNGKPLPPAPPPPVVNPKPIRQIADDIERTEKSSKGLLLTLKRVFAAFVVFRLLAGAVDAFKAMAVNAVQFNRQLETAKLGIATVLTASGKIATATGQQADAAQQLALAQGEAARQTKLLQRDALATTSTFEQLVETFQTALGPGLQAGLKVDEVRKFSIQISQAATAIGLSQNQLSEEIRSILTGSINPRNTRIATVLGITNADIKRAKELGTLSGFLSDKFKAFTQSGDELGNTFEGLVNLITSAFQIVGGEAAFGLFNSLKSLFKELFNLLIQIDAKTHSLAPNPAVVAAFKGIFSALQNVVDAAREADKSLDLKQLTAVTQVLGTVLEVLGKGLIGAIVGIIQGIAKIVLIAKTISKLVDQTIGPILRLFGGGDIQKFVAFLARIVVYFVTMKVLILTITLTTQTLTTAWALLRISIGVAVAATRSFALALRFAKIQLQSLEASTVIGLIAVAIGFLAELILNELTPSLKEFNDTAKEAERNTRAIGNAINDAFDGLPAQIRSSAESLKTFDDAIKSIREETVKLRREFFFKLGDALSFGKIASAESGPLGLFNAALQDSQDLEEKRKNLVKDVASARLREVAAVNKQYEIETRLESLNFQNKASGIEAVGVKNRLLDIYNELAKAQSQLNQLQKTGTNDAIEDAKKHAKFLGLADPTGSKEVEDKRLNATILKLKQEREGLIRGIASTAEETQIYLNLVRESVIATGDEASAKQDVVELEKALITLTEQSARGLNIRIAIESRRLAIAAQLNQIQLAAEQVAARRLLLTRDSNDAVKELVAGQNDLDGLKASAEVEEKRAEQSRLILNNLIAQGEQAKKNLVLQQESLQAQIDEAQRQGATRDDADFRKLLDDRLEVNLQILDNETALKEVIKERDAEQANADARRSARLDQIKLQEQNVADLAVKASDEFEDVGNQIDLALKELDQKLPTQFQQILDTLSSAITGFADFASDAIVDAFDPTKKGDISQKFGQFLQGIAGQIIRTLVQIAVTKAILGLSTLGFNAGGSVGLHHGGQPRRPRGHRRALGFADGGRVAGPSLPHMRPAGLHPDDKVPAWLSMEEFVQPVRAVRAYGLDFMEDLRTLALDPGAVRQALGYSGSRHARISTPRARLGFADGGSASGSSIRSAPAAGSGVTVATVVANEQNLDRLIAGGKGAFYRHLQDAGVAFR